MGNSLSLNQYTNEMTPSQLNTTLTNIIFDPSTSYGKENIRRVCCVGNVGKTGAKGIPIGIPNTSSSSKSYTPIYFKPTSTDAATYCKQSGLGANYYNANGSYDQPAGTQTCTGFYNDYCKNRHSLLKPQMNETPIGVNGQVCILLPDG